MDKTNPILPTDAAQREEFPLAEGCLDYFPAALAYVANLSWRATQQHHPDKPMHWDRTKSMGHRNKILRHTMESGDFDTDGVLHDVKVAWRALAQAQETLERIYGLPVPRAAIPLDERNGD